MSGLTAEQWRVFALLAKATACVPDSRTFSGRTDIQKNKSAVESIVTAAKVRSRRGRGDVCV